MFRAGCSVGVVACVFQPALAAAQQAGCSEPWFRLHGSWRTCTAPVSRAAGRVDFPAVALPHLEFERLKDTMTRWFASGYGG